jgi:hypothetical protein
VRDLLVLSPTAPSRFIDCATIPHCVKDCEHSDAHPSSKCNEAPALRFALRIQEKQLGICCFDECNATFPFRAFIGSSSLLSPRMSFLAESCVYSIVLLLEVLRCEFLPTDWTLRFTPPVVDQRKTALFVVLDLVTAS